MAIEREYQIKDYVVRKVKELGGVARKIKYENRNGCPDWLVVFGMIYLVELKSTHGKLRTSQAREIKKMKDVDVEVHVINSKAGIDSFIREIKWSFWLMREV